MHGDAVLEVDTDVDGSGVAVPVPALSLSALDGTNGFRLSGAGASNWLGLAVAGAGDVNGDGFADVILGAPFADGLYGAAYVVFGTADGYGANMNVSSLDGSNGFRLVFGAMFDGLGLTVSSAGDLNGDGLADVVVGAPTAEGPAGYDAGAAYVVFGSASGFAADLDLSTLDGSNGFTLSGGARDSREGSVRSAGDVNGDGIQDLIIGAEQADASGYNSGASYVLFGKPSGFAPHVDLSGLDGNNGFRLSGASANDAAGVSVSGAGDVNGDGFDDLVVGAAAADTNATDAGASYVVFGKAGTFAADFTLSAIDGTNGFKVSGSSTADLSGLVVGAAGDVNGDGFHDIVVGSIGNTRNGESFVIFGRADGFGENVDLSSLNGSNGFRLYSSELPGLPRVAISGAGDINGDGFDDVIVGGSNYGLIGASYLVFGKGAGFAATLDLATLDGSDGIKWLGVATYDQTGDSIGAAGDVNGDGFDDLLIGAPEADANGVNSGAAYMIFGDNFSGAVTHVGGAGDDSLAGTGAADRFVSGQGNDTIVGGGGADVFRGGEGDDRIVVPDSFFFRIDGGSGTDTLALAGSGLALNFPSLQANAVRGVEAIELTGSGDNTLRMGALDVLNLSDTSNRVRVEGDAGDVLHAEGAWVAQGAAVEGYQLYALGAAELQVNVAVSVELMA
jgi:hypothetical protein